MLQKFFPFLLNLIPLGGARTYVMGAAGLLLAAYLLHTGNWELGGTLLVLSLQVIFLRAGTENLTTAITSGLETIITRKTAVFSLPEVPLPDPLPEPDLPADKYPGMENNDRKATGQDIF